VLVEQGGWDIWEAQPYEKARGDWNKKLADEKKKAQGEN